MKILEITAHYYPNVGGVETHLLDLVKYLNRQNNEVSVLTYQPLTTKTSWRVFSKEDKVSIFRIPWIPGLFYIFVKYPFLEFIYLFPGLFIITPLIIFLKSPNVIHAHGLIAGFVAVIWGKLLNKRVVVATHSIYHFPKNGVYRQLVKTIFNMSDYVMGLSRQSVEEIISLGIPKEKVSLFTYWVDLNKFSKVSNAKDRLAWKDLFVVLFIGRLISEKGIKELIQAAKLWNPNIVLVIAGSGPLEEEIKAYSKNNIKYLGLLSQEELPLYYSAADIVVVPSIHDEGFGRVILEALACGTPVMGANRGAIPEAMDNTVGRIISVTPIEIAKVIDYFYNNQKALKLLSSNTRKFAQAKYSEKNAQIITKVLNE